LLGGLEGCRPIGASAWASPRPAAGSIRSAQQSGLLELFGSLQQKVAKSLHLSPCAIPHALAVRHDQVEHDDRFDVGARFDFLSRFV
jgi:hypothetical protein